MIVPAASAVVELLLGGRRAEAVIRWLEAEEGEIYTPALLDVEVVQAFRRLVASGTVEVARGGAAVEILQELPVTRYVETPLLPRLWELRANLTACDSTYVALAEALDRPLLTFDAGLAGALGISARMEVLS